MLTNTLSALFAAMLAAGAAGGSAPPAHAVVERIPGPDGGYDYLSVDSAAKRLFVARRWGVMAVDLDSGKVIERLMEANDVSAVLPIPGGPLMLSTAYGDDKAVLFDRRTGEHVAEIPTGQAPDAAAYDPASGLAFVMNAKSADVTAIDVGRRTSVATIPVGGKPEAAVSDGRGRLYVNIEDTAEVAVIDVASRKVVERLKLPGCHEPTGIAYDAAAGLLISACHNGVAKLVDARTGADRGSVAIGKDADGAIFDPATRLAYIPAKDGVLTVFRLGADGAPGPAQAVETEAGARTAALDPSTGRVYLAAQPSRLDAAGEDVPVPGAFKILVVAPR